MMTGTPGGPNDDIKAVAGEGRRRHSEMESASATPMRIAWVPVFLKGPV